MFDLQTADVMMPAALIVSGSGRFPACDPFGRRFSKRYCPWRAKMAGKLLADGYFGIFDGVQCDQEFLKKIFSLQRFLGALYASTPHIHVMILDIPYYSYTSNLRRLLSKIRMPLVQGLTCS